MVPDTFILNATRFILEHNLVQYANHAYYQNNGIPMGTNAAVNLANWYLAQNLDPHFLQHQSILHYKRYIDDLFFIWTGTLSELLTFYDSCQSLIPKIKFTKVHSTTNLVALDVEILKSPYGLISYRTYQKPINQFLYITPKSQHNPAVFKGFIKGELIRYSRTCSTPWHYANQKHLLYHRLLRRGHSKKFILPIFINHHYWDKYKPQPAKPNQLATFKIHYTPSPINKVLRQSIFHLQNTLPNTKMLISWKKSRNLSDYLCRSTLSQTQIDYLILKLGSSLDLN